MKAVLLFSISLISICAKAWPTVKNPFELITPPHKVQTISDCMHVASEQGDYMFKKIPHIKTTKDNVIDIGNPMEVCGLYIVSEPDTVIEITLKHFDINCEAGGLMAFVDGWELNGEYFPSVRDHHHTIEERTIEFCNDYSQWPQISHKKFFRSSQNAALLQYRIPLRGSFIANVRFRKIAEPCNIMVQDTASFYSLNNYGHQRNCTLTALFPAVISIINIKVGERMDDKVNYECTTSPDHLEIGGSPGLESFGMEKSSDVCGFSEQQGPEQAIFCGITSVRLVSSGKHRNKAALMVRQADENDLEIATLVCPL
ncbi:corticotropin-releasing factor-binding protein [Condylostylus longicornis]|uniref:corticotropin-releasing factor-binding protein n=1 Tax=Condylostylus longicornis TaxID=2530218 RepID=UPI00244E1C8B|nr:corticotropin-releasing factor-binding protein [Condylostylus longicornis]